MGRKSIMGGASYILIARAFACAKRLEGGRFLGDWSQVRTREMDWTGLKLLLEGIELGRLRKRYRYVAESKNPLPTSPLSLQSRDAEGVTNKPAVHC